MKRVYGIFGYQFALELSTRPDNYLGELPVWEKAEAALQKSLDEFGHPWTKDIGGGAFYGPKIDVKIQVMIRRKRKRDLISFFAGLAWTLSSVRHGAARLSASHPFRAGIRRSGEELSGKARHHSQSNLWSVQKEKTPPCGVCVMTKLFLFRLSIEETNKRLIV